MKNVKYIIIPLFLLLSVTTFARHKKVKISVSEQTAVIYANGKLMGTGSATVVVPAYGQLTVTVKLTGFLTAKQIFYNQPGYPGPPHTYYFELQKDDAYYASLSNDNANINISIVIDKKYTKDEAWELATQIVSDYFEVIELGDMETNYLRTTWSTQSFQQNTVRTKFVIKLGASSPLTYKIKLVSEYSGRSGTSVKSDEQFQKWDRVLRKYEDIITDFSTRLGTK